jgi:hypothetical protein
MVGFKFREKKESTYISVIISAESVEEGWRIFEETYVNNKDSFSAFDIDRRTIKTAGGLCPLTYDESVVIHGDLDELM